MSWMMTLTHQTYQPSTLPDWLSCLHCLSGKEYTHGTWLILPAAIYRLVHRNHAHHCDTTTVQHGLLSQVRP